MQRNNLGKNLKQFTDEYGEPYFPVSFITSLIMVLVYFIGLLLLVGLIWFSRCFANFLKTGGWSWVF